MRRLLAALLLIATPVLGEPLEELKLLAEHPVDGIPAGNLSGLAWCG
ncbi:MAG: DNA topoisomerase IV, partial [Pseudomonas sp.]